MGKLQLPISDTTGSIPKKINYPGALAEIIMFEVTKRDGAARIGELVIGDRRYTTPTLIHVDHERFSFRSLDDLHLPRLSTNGSETTLDGIPILELDEIVKGPTVSGSPTDRARDLVNDRQNAGYAKALYHPASGPISDMAQLVYCGTDLMDDARAIQFARRGVYLTEHGPVERHAWGNHYCFCPGCNGTQGSHHEFSDILLHNVLASLQELAAIRQYIESGKLRHLIEARMRSSPELHSLQRILDREFSSFFRQRLPFVGGGILGVSDDILHTPEVVSYHERFRQDLYRKPAGEVLVLLPCSARKPYSLSQSHRKFTSITGEFVGRVHEVIVTSPLGLVPRELEVFYPAANYDISVTGDWSSDEQMMVMELLTRYLKTNHHTSIINHTPYDFVQRLLDDDHIAGREGAGPDWMVIHTAMDGRPTSRKSLGSLNDALGMVTSGIRPMSPKELRIRVFRNMWEYLFGAGTGNCLDGLTVSGRFPFYKLFRERETGKRTQLAMVVPKSMRISLTLEGGDLLKDLCKNRVFIEDFRPSGDIFAVGIRDADPGVRVGDDVVVLHGDEVRGVGVSRMNGEEMVESVRGVAVKLRHRRK